jgi:hypothetical protein
MSLRSRINLGKAPAPAPAAKTPAAPAKTPAAAPPAAAPSKGPGKPQEGTLTFKCGHARELAKIALGPCQHCQEQAQRQAKVARAERRRKAAPQGFRLPHGSTLLATYDAGRECWSGTLEVPVLGPVSGEAGGVRALIDRLGQLAHARLAAQNGGSS